MSNKTTPIQRFLHRLHRSIFHTVPNPGLEVDLSRLKPISKTADFEPSLEWKFPERPSDPVGNRRT